MKSKQVVLRVCGSVHTAPYTEKISYHAEAVPSGLLYSFILALQQQTLAIEILPAFRAVAFLRCAKLHLSLESIQCTVQDARPNVLAYFQTYYSSWSTTLLLQSLSSNNNCLRNILYALTTLLCRDLLRQCPRHIRDYPLISDLQHCISSTLTAPC